MDKIIKITLGFFILILVVFVAFFSYMSYIDTTYRNSLSGTYAYTCTITTDAVISNVTFFFRSLRIRTETHRWSHRSAAGM